MTVQLRAGVGNGQANNAEDVFLLQVLLNQTQFGGLALTGVFDGPTGTAVEAFQRHQFGFSDRVISPNDIGIARLRGSGGVGDPVLVAQQDMVRRARVVEAMRGFGADPENIPFEGIRATADGLGHVGRWFNGDAFMTISSHPIFGTWEVLGLIQDKFIEVGFEGSELGNPISGERLVPPGAVSWFQRGSLIFDAESVMVTVNTNLPP